MKDEQYEGQSFVYGLFRFGLFGVLLIGFIIYVTIMLTSDKDDDDFYDQFPPR